MGNLVLVAAGKIDFTQLQQYCQQANYTIAIDGGLDYLTKIDITPNLVIGDFDSTQINIKQANQHPNFKICKFPSEKAETDTELALLEALKLDYNNIYILGATGKRYDHFLANVEILQHALNTNKKVYIIDKYNKISLINNDTLIEKEYKYISLIPFSEQVLGVSLTGFKYNLDDFNFTKGSVLGVSNEILDRFGKIEIKQGIFILIESKD